MNLTRRRLLQLAALLGVATATAVEVEHDQDGQWVDPAPPAPAASGWWPGASR